MTSENADAHARFPHCACVKEKKEAKGGIELQPPDLQPVVQTTGPPAVGSLFRSTLHAEHLQMHTLQVSRVSFPKPYMRLTSFQLWDRFFEKKKESSGRY